MSMNPSHLLAITLDHSRLETVYMSLGLSIIAQKSSSRYGHYDMVATIEPYAAVVPRFTCRGPT